LDGGILENKKINQNGKIAKIWKFGGCIAKIETLKVKLKMALNFGGVKCNFFVQLISKAKIK
jgi:hypothetical protein